MSKDSPTVPAGLLSKVARFVRNPATNWGDLDGLSEGRDEVHSKQALQEMIERKRRNDFVRKREFEMLRKLRSITTGCGPGLRWSAIVFSKQFFFQTGRPGRNAEEDQRN